MRQRAPPPPDMSHINGEKQHVRLHTALSPRLHVFTHSTRQRYGRIGNAGTIIQQRGDSRRLWCTTAFVDLRHCYRAGKCGDHAIISLIVAYTASTMMHAFKK